LVDGATDVSELPEDEQKRLRRVGKGLSKQRPKKSERTAERSRRPSTRLRTWRTRNPKMKRLQRLLQSEGVRLVLLLRLLLANLLSQSSRRRNFRNALIQPTG
jgi:hypothetical protein